MSAFKKELLDLMIRHNVDAISWTCGDCSDLHGVYDEEMVISFADDTPSIRVDGGCISQSDLSE